MKIKIPALFLGSVITAAIVPGPATAQLFKLKPSEAELLRIKNAKKAFTPAAARECENALRKKRPLATRKGSFQVAPRKAWAGGADFSVPYGELAVIGAFYAEGPDALSPGKIIYSGCSMRVTQNKMTVSNAWPYLIRVRVNGKDQ